jgi:prepilin signal peptidase PulO-like enzyme (type II secretory pathway)
LDCPEPRDRLIGKDELKGDFFLTPRFTRSPSILTLIPASFAGVLVGVFFIMVRKKDMQFALPFGTFLAPAAVVAMLWGERIIRAYLSLYQK